MFRKALWCAALSLVAALIGFQIAWALGVWTRSRSNHPAVAKPQSFVEITLAATIDGSERFIFTRDGVWDDHGRWQPPTDVRFNGVPWTDLSQAPEGWADLAASLDLSRAKLTTRNGRDIIALETTAEGFDLYFADTPMGAGKYAVTISIPRK